MVRQRSQALQNSVACGDNQSMQTPICHFLPWWLQVKESWYVPFILPISHIWHDLRSIVMHDNSIRRSPKRPKRKVQYCHSWTQYHRQTYVADFWICLMSNTTNLLTDCESKWSTIPTTMLSYSCIVVYFDSVCKLVLVLAVSRLLYMCMWSCHGLSGGSWVCKPSSIAVNNSQQLRKYVALESREAAWLLRRGVHLHRWREFMKQWYRVLD